MVTLNSRKVGLFLKGINEAERVYLGHTLNFSNNLLSLIRDFKLSKKQVCDKFEISPKKYNNFICGNQNYDLKDMARLNAWFMELKIEELKKEAPVQVAR
jgi:hypothetical protein